jgi:hypothetical protein
MLKQAHSSSIKNMPQFSGYGTIQGLTQFCGFRGTSSAVDVLVNEQRSDEERRENALRPE